MFRRSWILLICLTLFGCAQSDSPDRSILRQQPPVGRSLAALVPVDGCSDLLTQLQEQAIKKMEERIDHNLEISLGYDFTALCDLTTWFSGEDTENSDNGAAEYSDTNVQVPGVDEADFIKNDGEYIYILADNRFQIIDSWPPEAAHVISEYEIEGLPRKMFVHAERALIYSSLADLRDHTNDNFISPWYIPAGYEECTYGYNCDFSGDGRALKITVLDISDRTDPKLLREVEFSGSLINARRINNAVFSVVSFPQTELEGVLYNPVAQCDSYRIDYTDEEIIEMYETLRENNRAIILSSTLSDWIPGVTDTRWFNGTPVMDEGLLQNCSDYCISQQTDGRSLLSLAALDMTELGSIDITTIVDRPGAVYASPDALYISSRHRPVPAEPWFFDNTVNEASTVHKFDLQVNPPAVFYAGSGGVKGHVLNQFSMDEFNGYLRIATTTPQSFETALHSTVTILEENSAELRAIGLLDDIAPTEDIRSVRFDKERGFLVTFKKTDPLFALDLSDPTNPNIQGELHIPGFSTYIHLLDQNHLLSIGYDAQDEGNFAWFQGILLQIFDIQDMANPTLSFREVIGTRGSTSEAATNHLAFNYFRPRNLLAIPMVICEGGSDWNFGNQMTFGGLLVYRATAQSGFEFLGGIPHVEPETEESIYSACYNWWTDSNSYVQRSVFMDDYVFSVAANSIEVARLEDLENVLAVIDLLNGN
jgi:uncharacterized secreted protein with C-terminal beta-propeller domain